MAIKTLHPLILASQSTIRQKMLQDAGISFVAMPAPVDEAAIRKELSGESLPELALALARAKAKAVSLVEKDSLVIGSDQICAQDGMVFSKPGNIAQGKAQLMVLSGRAHEQHSAVALYRGGSYVWGVADSAELHMRELEESEIDSYLSIDNPVDACGSYHFEGYGRHLFKSIRGSYDCILGLPLQPLIAYLHEKKIISF